MRAVRGNADEAALRASLPRELIVEVGEVRIGMTHVPGPRAGRERRLSTRFTGCAAVVYGHTHLPQVELVDEVWIVNPGSPTERRSASSRAMLLLEIAGERIQPELIELP